MKKIFKIFNAIAAITLFIFAMAVDSSDIAIKICFLLAGYLFLYNFRRDILWVVYKVLEFFVDAFKELMQKR